jgi:hypothetical protein
MKKIVILLILVLFFGGGIYLGYFIGKPPVKETKVNSEVILTILKNEGFLITQSYLFNQIVTIDKTSGNEWKDIFWGQTITASANLKVSSGVNLSKLNPQDITVSEENITILLPPIEDQSVEIVGDIILQNKQGILKKVFDNDSGYNTAYEKLKAEALRAAQNVEIRQEAQKSTQKQIVHLVEYINPGKKISVEFKK